MMTANNDVTMNSMVEAAIFTDEWVFWSRDITVGMTRWRSPSNQPIWQPTTMGKGKLWCFKYQTKAARRYQPRPTVTAQSLMRHHQTNKWSTNLTNRRIVTPTGGKWIRPTLTTSKNGSLDPHKSVPNGISIGSAVHECDQPTNRHTDRPRYSLRPYDTLRPRYSR